MTEKNESKAKKVDVTVKKAAETAEPAGSTPGGLSEGNPYAALAPSEFGERPLARGDLMQRIMEDPRMHDHLDGFESCIQCGVCTSGCPAARFTDYSPREIARRALDGDETLLTDDSVWYCFYCYTCQSRCPRHNSVAVLNQIIRGMQCDTGYGVKHVEMFSAWGEQYYDKGMGGTPQVFFHGYRRDVRTQVEGVRRPPRPAPRGARPRDRLPVGQGLPRASGDHGRHRLP